MNRHLPECPHWCGGGHHCTVWQGHPSGQHRSVPRRIKRPWGHIVYTRILNRGDAESQMELRTVVWLSRRELVAQVQAEQMAAEIDQAVQTALAAGECLDVNEPEWAAIYAANAR